MISWRAAGLAIAASIMSVAAVAQTDPASTAILQCTRIASSVERLACFDTMAKPYADATNALAAQMVGAGATGDTGRWQVGIEKSKLDDSTNATVFIDAGAPVQDRYGRGKPMQIIFFCRERKTSAFIQFGGKFMAAVGNTVPVTYRIDSAPAQTRRFFESNDHMALGLDGGDAIQFARSLLNRKSLFVQATPYSDNTVTGDFEIAGLDNALKPLATACGWSLAAPKPTSEPPAKSRFPLAR